MVPIHEDMAILLKDKNRSKADDMLLKQQLNERMDQIQTEMKEINFVIRETLCPLTVCLFENQNIQLRAEE